MLFVTSQIQILSYFLHLMFFLCLSAYSATFDDIMFTKTNEWRVKQGKPAFKRNRLLDQAAMDHSKYLRSTGQRGHSGPPGAEDPGKRIQLTGYVDDGFAENVAYDRPNRWASVLIGWIHSQAHVDNILGDYEDIGIGSASTDKIRYWTQCFANPKNQAAKDARYEGPGKEDETTGYVGKHYTVSSEPSPDKFPAGYMSSSGIGGDDGDNRNIGISVDDVPTGTGPAAGNGKAVSEHPGENDGTGGAKAGAGAGADKSAGAGADKAAGAGAGADKSGASGGDKSGGGAGAGGADKSGGGAGASTPGGGAGAGGADKSGGGAGNAGAGGAGAGADKSEAGGGASTPGGGGGGGGAAGGGGGGAGGGGSGGADKSGGGAGGAGAGGGEHKNDEDHGPMDFDPDCDICKLKKVEGILNEATKKWLNLKSLNK